MSIIRAFAAAAPIAALLHVGAAQATAVLYDDEAAFLAAAAAAGISLGFESFESHPNDTNPPISTPDFTADGFLFVLDDNAGAANFATDGTMTLVSNSSNQPRFSFASPVNAFAIDVIDILTGPGVGTFGVTIDDRDPVVALSGQLQPFFNVEFIGILDLGESFSEVTLNTVGSPLEAFNLDRLQFGALDEQPVPVPAPASLPLLLAGIGTVVWFRRHRADRRAARTGVSNRRETKVDMLFPRVARLSAVTLLAMLVASVAVVRAPSAAVLIDFDDIGTLQEPGASYAGQGILFGAGFLTLAQDFLGAVAIPSAPNYLTIAGTETQAVITFVDPVDPGRKAITDVFGFDNAGLTDQNPTGFFDGLEIVLLDRDGLQIGGATIDPVGPPALGGGTRGISQTVFAIPGIHQVVFTKLTNSAGNGALTPIDNVTFNAVTPVPVPAPASAGLLLFATGLIGLGLALRRSELREIW